MIKKAIFIIFGLLFSVAGIIGIFIPILPTTPLLLLAAILFSKSSERFLHWLYTNRLCGAYIRNYREGRGMALNQKFITIILLWLTIGGTVVFFIDALWLKLLLFVIASAVTIHLIMIKTYRPVGIGQMKDSVGQGDGDRII